MNKLLAATCLVAFATLADGQAVWRFEKADADAAGGPGAAAKTQKKTPKTGDTTVLNLPGGENCARLIEKANSAAW